MWNTINNFLSAVDDFVWGVPLMVLIMAGGIMLTVGASSDEKASSGTKVDGQK